MTSVLHDPIRDWINLYLTAKRSFDIVERIINLLDKETCYEGYEVFALDAFYSMVDGIILELCKTDEALRVTMPVAGAPCPTCNKGTKTPKPGPIGKLLKKHLGELRRDAWKHWPNEESWERLHRERYEQVFDRTFPDVVQRGGLSPTFADLAEFSKEVSAAVHPARLHRNKAIAHNDKPPKPVTFDDIRNAFAKLDDLLRDLSFVATGGTETEMKLGGADPARFAKAFVDLMIIKRL